jgi:LytS/YehU family sensor histidine kinase
VPVALRAHRVPTLVLQPLVENAIKHGVAPSKTGGDVEVSARTIEHSTVSQLELIVRNTGASLHAARGPVPGEQVGVENIRRRLAGHYGAAARLTLTARGDYTVATLVMPLTPDVGRIEDSHHAEAIASRSR